MQKISTLPRSGSRILKERKLTIGLDLGDRSSWYCVLDEAGEIILEHKLATTPDAMRAMR
jgi:transposase